MRAKTYISSLIGLLAVSTVIAVGRGGKRLDSRAETLPAVANANGLVVTDHAVQPSKCAEDESKHNFSFLRINWGEVVGVGRADGDAKPITQGWHLKIVFRVQGESIPIAAFDEVIGGNEDKLAPGMKELELVLYRPDAQGQHFGIFNTGEFIELDSYVTQIEVYIIKHENEGVEAGLIHDLTLFCGT